MANSYFQFKQFTVHQEHCAMKVTTDACLFGAWAALHCSNTIGTTSPSAMLDIGTGTGLLSLMISQKADVRVDAIEIDEPAYKQAGANFKSSPWHDRINAIHADARDYDKKNLYDIIVCNPPFYENELRSPFASRNKAHHDESLLLPELFTVIKKNLRPGGMFFMILPFKRAAEMQSLLDKNEMAITQLALVRQSTSHSPFRVMVAGILEQSGSAEYPNEEIVIKDGEGKYTTGFVDYLRDYYLYL